MSKHCQAPVRYFIRRLLGGPEGSEDVLQDMWVSVLRNIRRLKRADAFPVWLYRIARNEAYRELRRRSLRPVPNAEIVAAQEEESEENFLPDEAPRVHAGLAKLGPEHREVLVLRFLEEMSYEEIAGVVGCGVGTVRSRIHYAKRALRRVMEESNHDERDELGQGAS